MCRCRLVKQRAGSHRRAKRLAALQESTTRLAAVHHHEHAPQALREAWHYKEYQHEQTTHDRLVYRDEEGSAKARRAGLWKDAMPVPPWEWRRISK